MCSGKPKICVTCSSVIFTLFRWSETLTHNISIFGLPRWRSGKESACQWRRCQRPAQVQSLTGEDPLESDMATHSSILAWEIPRTEEPGGLQSMGLQRVGHNWAHTYMPIFTWIFVMSCFFYLRCLCFHIAVKPLCFLTQAFKISQYHIN